MKNKDRIITFLAVIGFISGCFTILFPENGISTYLIFRGFIEIAIAIGLFTYKKWALYGFFVFMSLVWIYSLYEQFLLNAPLSSYSVYIPNAIIVAFIYFYLWKKRNLFK